MKKKVIVFFLLMLLFVSVLMIVQYTRFGGLTGFAIFGESDNVFLESAYHAGASQSDVFVKDEVFYLADMKDSSKNFYLNFSENLVNESILKFYAKINKGVPIGIYAQSDSAGSNPLGILAIDSVTGRWYNVSLNINNPTKAIWIGEGTGSGIDPKDEFDYIIAINPIIDSDAPAIEMVYPENITYGANVTELKYIVSDEYLDSCWYSLDLGETNFSIVCGNNITGLNSDVGRWIVYANDSSGNENYSSVIFSSVVNSAPSVNIINPIDGENVSENSTIGINFTAVDSDGNLDSCWYNIDYDSDIILENCSNATIALANGTYVLNVYANDSLGVEQGASIIFAVNNSYTKEAENSGESGASSGGGGGGGSGGSSAGSSIGEVVVPIAPEVIEEHNLNFEIKNYEKVGEKLRVYYSLSGEEGRDVAVNYEIIGLDGKSLVLGSEVISLGEDSFEIELPARTFGEFNLRLLVSDGAVDKSVEEKVYIPLRGMTGLAVEGESRNITLVGLIAACLFVLFFVVKFLYSYHKRTFKEGGKKFITLDFLRT